MTTEQKKITALITDLDGCLWEGTLAEKESLQTNNAYYNRLKELYHKGIQLFVVSKNNIEDVEQAFDAQGISRDMFTQIIANWEPKYLNIERLLVQTAIPPERVIYIDDNPLELTEVATTLPQATCSHFTKWKIILDNPYFTSLATISGSLIRERINRYRTAISAAAIKEHVGHDETFLRQLKRKLALGEISESEDIGRLANLLALTHRINFNPEKFADASEAKNILLQRMKLGHKLYGVSVWENDLPLGLSGGFVVELNVETAKIEDATFSCGIIGRDFEQRAFVELFHRLQKEGIKKIIFSVTPTSTNLRVINILNELEFKKSKLSSGRICYSRTLNNEALFKTYDWIEIIETPDFSAHAGMRSVIDFFDNEVAPRMPLNSRILNIGAAHGEVIGHLLPERKQAFYAMIKERHIQYDRLDLEPIAGENNIVGNAEDLQEIIGTESCEMVWAIELLEHTQHFWKVIGEMIRTCKVDGYIFITIPSFSYPKHEYPIDLWRIGPNTLLSFFPEEYFELVALQKEGDQKFPRKLQLLIRKKKEGPSKFEMPQGGKTDWKTGITFFE